MPNLHCRSNRGIFELCLKYRREFGHWEIMPLGTTPLVLCPKFRTENRLYQMHDEIMIDQLRQLL